MRVKSLMPLSALVALAACSSDPANEPPITLQGGRYEVTLGGGTLVELKSGGRTTELCLTDYDAAQLPADPLGALVERWPNCALEADPRRGNAISGRRRCEQRAMPMTASYTGRITADGFTIDGMVAQSDDEGGGVMHLGSGEFRLTGKRVGLCAY